MESRLVLRMLLSETAMETGREDASRRRVLVVDDDTGIRDVLRDILEDAGYLVDEAANGKSALRMLRASGHPRIVLLDLWMPEMDGLGVLGAVAEDAILRSRHAFVLVTADPRAARRVDERLAGALHVPIIAKPFEMAELLGVIEALGCALDGNWQGGSEADDSWHRQMRLIPRDF